MSRQSSNTQSVESDWDRGWGKRGNHVFAGQWNLISLVHFTNWNSAGATLNTSDRKLLIRNVMTSVFQLWDWGVLQRAAAYCIPNISNSFHKMPCVWSCDPPATWLTVRPASKGKSLVMMSSLGAGPVVKYHLDYECTCHSTIDVRLLSGLLLWLQLTAGDGHWVDGVASTGLFSILSQPLHDVKFVNLLFDFLHWSCRTYYRHQLTLSPD